MAELYLSGPDAVTVTKDDNVSTEAFAEMTDALAHVALESTERYVTLPLRDPAAWLWYFADPAGPFSIEASLVERLRHQVVADGVRLDVLSQSPATPGGRGRPPSPRCAISASPASRRHRSAATWPGTSPWGAGPTSRCPAAVRPP